MALKIGLLVLDFYLEGCCSLKEKRRRLSGLRERFGKQPNLAVCESDHQDDLQRSQWSFVATSSNGVVVSRTLDKVEERIDNDVDAVIVGSARENL